MPPSTSAFDALDGVKRDQNGFFGEISKSVSMYVVLFLASIILITHITIYYELCSYMMMPCFSILPYSSSSSFTSPKKWMRGRVHVCSMFVPLQKEKQYRLLPQIVVVYECPSLV